MIYLYVKRHTVTGLKYFGKTIKDPYKYNGSGRAWQKHLKQHGKRIETLNVWPFDDLNSAIKFAENFSAENNIVESSEWANMIPETVVGSTMTEETKSKLSAMLKGKVRPDYIGERLSKSKTGVERSPEARKRLSAGAKNRLKLRAMRAKWYAKHGF